MARACAVIDWLLPVVVTAVVCAFTWGEVAWSVAHTGMDWLAVALLFGPSLGCAYWCGREHGGRRRG